MEASVNVIKHNGGYAVRVMPKNVPEGNIGGAGTIRPCGNKEEAKKLAQKIKQQYKNSDISNLPRKPGEVVFYNPHNGTMTIKEPNMYDGNIKTIKKDGSMWVTNGWGKNEQIAEPGTYSELLRQTANSRTKFSAMA